MRLRSLALVVGLVVATAIFFSAELSVAQSRKGELTIEDVMTSQELKDTGVAGLTETQRTALDVWLNRYTQAVIKLSSTAKPYPDPKPYFPSVPAAPSCKTYPNTGEKESITSNADGKILILDDGSMWQVMEIDTIDSALWLAVDDVIIIRADRPIGCNTYTIINTDESGEKVQAQYLGQR
jgi:hypothetical protein